ncbi:heme ABC transporter substrate-binding protein IsdE [Marinisporobacter balticus]|uniref:High-affinity heme uptake system protein IsdE n=1 Tax=Marinisporobacter balticus TaxID=2018667 RepID=A0A4R2K9V1_9FIRM|nr:heme ABC transporter substrate-binding protein IsdE [Marinisporobacter balticus]TCO68922.1 iron complex transport system substrate-binding protein [Marinisporobacter balticus]
MKRLLALMMIVVMSIMFVACGAKGAEMEQNSTDTKKEDIRIVAGSVAVAEMLLALDIPMVGRPSTQYGIADELKELPEIGLPMNPDLEVIKSLGSDIFVTSGALKELIGSKFEQNGINPRYADLSSYDAVKETIKELASEFGKEENGKKIIEAFEKKEKEIFEDIDLDKKVKVMILFGAPGNFMLATEKSFAGSLIPKLGAENITSKVKSKYKGAYVPFSLEVALKENPDIIFRMYHGYIDEAKKQVQEEFEKNPQWEKFKAVKENKVYDLDPKYFGVTGDMGATESLGKMKAYLYK